MVHTVYYKYNIVYGTAKKYMCINIYNTRYYK